MARKAKEKREKLHGGCRRRRGEARRRRRREEEQTRLLVLWCVRSVRNMCGLPLPPPKCEHIASTTGRTRCRTVAKVAEAVPSTTSTPSASPLPLSDRARSIMEYINRITMTGRTLTYPHDDDEAPEGKGTMMIRQPRTNRRGKK